MENGQKCIRVQVQVENIGMRPGKETVQLYVSAPQGALGKPALELKAFQKTRLLQPGETACVSFTVPEEQLASYDDSGVTGAKSAYVLEPGDYFFYVGTASVNGRLCRLTERLRGPFLPDCYGTAGGGACAGESVPSDETWRGRRKWRPDAGI